MSKTRIWLVRVLKGLFLLSYVLLALWAFPSVRQSSRLYVMRMFGAASDTDIPVSKEDIFLSQFQPNAELKHSEHLIDHPAFNTIEFHGHLFTGPFTDPPADIIQKMDKARIKWFIDLSLFTSTLHDYEQLKKKTGHDDRILHFVGFHWKRTKESDDYGKLMAADLEAIAKAGVRGVKLWKNFGLMEKKKDGTLIAMDDPALDPVWDVCAKYKLLVAMHTADPPAFFKKIDNTNERFEELARRPEWSFASPSLPTFEKIMEQRDRLFTRRKDVTFVALHFGEFGHDLQKAKDLLDRHPNVNLDIAQRIDELGRQPAAAREFLNKYQDRIVYGTDGLPDFEKIRIYWRFLETDDEYFSYYPQGGKRKGIWNISGLKLSAPVLEKIYYKNAARLLRIN